LHKFIYQKTADKQFINLKFIDFDSQDYQHDVDIFKNEPIKTLITYIKNTISYPYDIKLIVDDREINCNINISINSCGIKDGDVIMVYKTDNNNYYKIMNEIYDNIISKNYDLSILNLYNDEFINEFRSFIMNKPNFLILNELLNNFQNNRIIKPYNYDYLSGVLCVYRLQKNDMTIYLFGESHFHRDACNNNLNTKVEDFLEEVINKSSVFIDFYIRITN
jgi:hypothetical protein